MRLIDADALKQKLKMADDCPECSHYKRSQYRCSNELVTDDFCRAIDDAPTIETGWIPCKKELPKDNMDVLVTVGVNQSGEGMHQEVRVALWDNIGKRFHVYEDKGTIIGEVRSWAYLPNPYDVGVVWYTRGAI